MAADKLTFFTFFKRTLGKDAHAKNQPFSSILSGINPRGGGVGGGVGGGDLPTPHPFNVHEKAHPK